MVSVTDTAHEKLIEIIGAKDSGVRVDAIRGPHGCVHGWQLALEDNPRADDVVIPIGEASLLIGPQVAELLTGATIDYHEDDRGIGFAVDAPAAGHGHGTGGCQHGH